MMLIVDAHQDIAYNALGYGRDYRKSAWDHREREQGAYARATIGLPDALLGRVGLIFATLFTEPYRRNSTLSKPPFHVPEYKTPQQAHDFAMQQLDYYRKLADEDARVRLVLTQADLAEVEASWADGTTTDDHLHGLVILMENGDPIIEPKQFEEWYERGVRLVGPAWTASRYCGGTGAPGGLTALGYELLEQLAGYNAILDVSHMAEKSFYDAIDAHEGLVIASHSNPRKFRNTDRHLSDDMILRLAERDGVMGVVLFNRFLSDTWTPSDPNDRVTLATVVSAIDHVCQLTGSASHVGIGSDLDGGFGAESTPDEIETTADLHLIGKALREKGYAPDDVNAIMGGNFLRKLRECLPS